MAERARFEIYPEQYFLNSEGTGPTAPTGRYRWRFAVGDYSVCSSTQSFAGRELANGDIHEFIRAIYGAECGIHPDIIDLDDAP